MVEKIRLGLIVDNIMRSNLPEFFKFLLAALPMDDFVWLASDMLPLTYVPVWQSVLMCFAVISLGVIIYGMLLLVMKNRLALEAISAIVEYMKAGAKLSQGA